MEPRVETLPTLKTQSKVYFLRLRGKGDYNIGSQRRVTVNQIVEALDQSMDKKSKLII